MREPGASPRRAWILAGWMLAGGFFAVAHAQYPGRMDPNKGATAAPVLRATAVLEYTGDLTKPTAARLVPLAVWDGERYQPGGLYLANPVPLTVEAGTVYELLDAGASKGLFNVTAAANAQGSWVATGSYQKPAPPKVSKLKPSKTVPQFVKDAGSDDGKPHFAHRPPPDSGTGTGSGQSGSGSGSGSGSASGSGSGAGSGSGSGSTSSASDPDKPTLHRRTDSGSSSGSGSSDSGSSGSSTASSAPPVDPDRPTLHKPTDSSSGPGSGSSAGSNAPTVDPDRPTLHKQSATNPNDNGAPVSATTNTDPDRPHLGRGKPAEQQRLDVPSTVEIAKLAGSPENLKLIAAVSDAKTREAHSYVYSWPDPEDAKKMQSALEDVAKNLVAGNPLPAGTSGQSFGSGTAATSGTAKASATGAKTASTKTASTKTTSTKTGVARKAAAAQKPALPDLADEQFKAYELSFGGGATLVFSATSGQGDQAKWVTIIAQPDFNGVPQILFKQVTSEPQLDAVPRMRLVDAVDTDADNRAELIFELAGRTDQQFAIYKVHDREVEQVFSTGGS
jgi:hypothetical protein